MGNIDPVYLKISDNFGLGRAQTLLGIVFPAIFPQIANALHIAAGTAWIFLVVGEMAGSQSGLGYLITDARNNLQTDTLMATIIAIGIIGIVLDLLIAPCTAACGTHLGIQQERRKIASDQRSMP